ncbi:hypothetical protein CLV55_104166 [Flavobacterium aciduliphilum]|uniref:Uncharacterized protein n=1 Tax=Flavobacterium aciduliphilum TaxID=1101402 RepID=A0A328YJE5_9FLAO|nr:hypothetical protein CLV55_104166 [Flavobacterium aciduliphilum]
MVLNIGKSCIENIFSLITVLKFKYQIKLTHWKL